MRRADLALLRDRDIALLIGSRAVTRLGSAMSPVALAFGVLALPGGSAGELGAVLTAYALAQLAGVLWGGVAADRIGPVRVMVASEAASALAGIGMAALLWSGRPVGAGLLALSALSGASGSLFYPASTAIMPAVVGPDRVQSANGLLQVSGNLARIVGAALGGLLVAVIGSPAVLLLDAGTFVVSGILLALLRLRQARVGTSSSTGVLRDLRDGWSAFRSFPWAVALVGAFLLSNIGFGAVFGVYGPLRAQQAFGGASAWGLVLSAMALGTVVGVVVAVRVRPRRPLVVGSLWVLAEAVFLVTLAVPAPYALVLAAALLAGVGVDVFEVLWQTVLQQQVPADQLARVSSYDWFGSLLAVPLGMALAGPVEGAIGLDAAFWWCVALCVVPTLAVCLLPSVRAVRLLTDPS